MTGNVTLNVDSGIPMNAATKRQIDLNTSWVCEIVNATTPWEASFKKVSLLKCDNFVKLASQTGLAILHPPTIAEDKIPLRRLPDRKANLESGAEKGIPSL